MSRKTIKDEACDKVDGFYEICEAFTRKFTVAGKSESFVDNYLLQISKLVLFYERSPLELSIDELEEYLLFLRANATPSLSTFKHLVYGLRQLYRIYGKKEMELALPEIEYPVTLPVVLSKEEVKRLILIPKYQKHRLIIGTIYDGGLRISELINLQIKDVDFDRKTIHIRQSKYKKDRYVPISTMLIRGLKGYIDDSNPQNYLFNGRIKGSPISEAAVRHLLGQGIKRVGIKKKVCVHTLRHSYATHLLEDGLDIVTLKNQMGHVKVQTTMIYLHIAQVAPLRGFSPLSTLFPKGQ
jgi:integrase/recombinase XerD